MKHNCHTKSSGTLQNRAVFRDGSFCFPPSVEPETITTGIKGKGMKTQTWHTGNYRAKLANAFVRTARSSLAVSEKSSSPEACGIFPENLALPKASAVGPL